MAICESFQDTESAVRMRNGELQGLKNSLCSPCFLTKLGGDWYFYCFVLVGDLSLSQRQDMEQCTIGPVWWSCGVFLFLGCATFIGGSPQPVKSKKLTGMCCSNQTELLMYMDAILVTSLILACLAPASGFFQQGNPWANHYWSSVVWESRWMFWETGKNGARVWHSDDTWTLQTNLLKHGFARGEVWFLEQKGTWEWRELKFPFARCSP